MAQVAAGPPRRGPLRSLGGLQPVLAIADAAAVEHRGQREEATQRGGLDVGSAGGAAGGDPGRSRPREVVKDGILEGLYNLEIFWRSWDGDF